MAKSIYRLAFLIGFLSLTLTSAENVLGQKRRAPAAKKPVAEKVSDEEMAATLENLQGAKVYQLLAELQLGLAEAWVNNKAAGELKANSALTKLSVEFLRKPTSMHTIYAHARGYSIWTDYYLNRHGLGADPKIDGEINQNIEIIRKVMEKGLALNANSPQMIAVRGTLREFECRIKLKSSLQECFDVPLADFSRAIALQPDETDFFSLRAEFFERQQKPSLAAFDNQSAKSLGNAMELKLTLDKTATARRPFHLERANADMLYFMNIVSLLQDPNVKVQLNYDAATLKAFRDKLFSYYELADKGYLKVIDPKQAAEIAERRATLRYHLGIFANDLGVEQPADFAQKNFTEAIEFYTNAIKSNPNFADAYKYRARTFRKLGKNDLAETDEKYLNSLTK